jgi:hypothetical protein
MKTEIKQRRTETTKSKNKYMVSNEFIKERQFLPYKSVCKYELSI